MQDGAFLTSCGQSPPPELAVFLFPNTRGAGVENARMAQKTPEVGYRLINDYNFWVYMSFGIVQDGCRLKTTWKAKPAAVRHLSLRHSIRNVDVVFKTVRRTMGPRRVALHVALEGGSLWVLPFFAASGSGWHIDIIMP